MAWFVRVVRAMAACAQRPRFALDPEGSRELFSAPLICCDQALMPGAAHPCMRSRVRRRPRVSLLGVCGGVGGDATGETCFVTSAVVLRLFVSRALDSDISRRHWAIRTICAQLIVGM